MINITKDWTLFLDRDGVINKRIIDNYVKEISEFEFLPGVIDSFKIFNQNFYKILVVTNQQGIGKGLMTEDQLIAIHNFMRTEVDKNNGRIDQVYYSPHLKDSNSITRKPAVGLGLQARSEFPEIIFSKSIMVGDSYSDILFGYKLGMKTVFIGNTNSIENENKEIIDFIFPDLISFAKSLTFNY